MLATKTTTVRSRPKSLMHQMHLRLNIHLTVKSKLISSLVSGRCCNNLVWSFCQKMTCLISTTNESQKSVSLWRALTLNKVMFYEWSHLPLFETTELPDTSPLGHLSPSGSLSFWISLPFSLRLSLPPHSIISPFTVAHFLPSEGEPSLFPNRVDIYFRDGNFTLRKPICWCLYWIVSDITISSAFLRGNATISMLCVRASTRSNWHWGGGGEEGSGLIHSSSDTHRALIHYPAPAWYTIVHSCTSNMCLHCHRLIHTRWDICCTQIKLSNLPFFDTSGKQRAQQGALFSRHG